MRERRLDTAETLRRKLCYEMWNIGVVNQPAADIVARGIQKPVHWFSRLPPGTMFADPACLSYPDGRRTVFVEAMNCREGRGEIWSADILPGDNIESASFTPRRQASFHMSYPFPLFDDVGSPLLTFESWQDNRAALWRIEDSCLREIGTLLDGRPALDPTLWRGPDLWWLFCTFRDDGPDSRLHLFFAEKLHGPWSPHPRNPVVVDFAGARPAGSLFMAGDELIRPAQDCSTTYGGALALKVVRVLTREDYQEELVRRLDPQPGLFPSGLHTFCSFGDATLIDGKRWHFDSIELFGRIRRKLATTLS